MEKRWKEAQKAEFNGWLKSGVRESELEEVKTKYQDFLKKTAVEIGYRKSWKVLDLGCGPTCISRFFPSADKIGIDPLASQLGIENKVVSGVKVVSGKGENLPLEDNKFNLIICRNVIDHTENPTRVISETKRVLVDSGYLILAGYVYAKPVALAKKISEKIPFLRNVEHPFTFTIDSFKKLAGSDFTICKEYIIHTGYHPNDYGKIGEEKSKWNFLQRVVIFINFKIFKEKWFVREYCLVLKKKYPRK